MKRKKYQHTPAFNMKQIIKHAYADMGGLQMKWIEANKMYLGRQDFYVKVKWDKWYYPKLRIKKFIRWVFNVGGEL